MEVIVILSVEVQPCGLMPRYASYEYSHKYNVFCFDACLLYFCYWACWDNIELEYRVTEVGRESGLVVIKLFSMSLYSYLKNQPSITLLRLNNFAVHVQKFVLIGKDWSCALFSLLDLLCNINDRENRRANHEWQHCMHKTKTNSTKKTQHDMCWIPFYANIHK